MRITAQFRGYYVKMFHFWSHRSYFTSEDDNNPSLSQTHTHTHTHTHTQLGWVLYKARRLIDCIQPYLITNMGLNSRKALTLLCTPLHNLGIEVALWNQNQPTIKTCKVCKEGLVEDEYHLLFTCSPYSAIRESYDDILRGGDDLSIALKRTPRRLSSYVCGLFTVLESMNIPSKEGDTH